MAQVIPRGRGYYSDFRTDGRRIRRFLDKDKRQAQIKLGKLLEQMRGDDGGQPSKNISWADFKKKYLEYCEGSKRNKTVLRDRYTLHAFEEDFPNILQLAQVTPEIMELWKTRRLKEGMGKPTINRDMTAMKAMLHKAEAWGYLDKRNWASVKEIKVTRKKLYFHSPKELGTLLTRCKGVWRTICLLGARAGLRREEMYMLTWEDVDFSRSRIHITPKDGWEPKDYEQRFIGMPRDLREHLLRLTKSVNPGRWVLGRDRPSLGVISAYMAKLTRKAGLKGAIQILRHTFASHLVQAGVPLKTVKDLLGHSNMATTEIYAELAPENIDAAVSKLPEIPGSA